jgi:endonuclease IV
METAHAIGSEGVIFHLGSHLGRGFDAAMHQVIPALQVVSASATAMDSTRGC